MDLRVSPRNETRSEFRDVKMIKKKVLERIKESNVRLYKNGLTSARGKWTNLGYLKN